MKKLTAKEILEDHDIFTHYDHPEKDGVLRFLMMCYSKDSEYLQKYENLDERRRKVAQICKISEYEDIITLEDEEFRELLDYYLCKIEHNNTFQMLVSSEIAFQEYQQLIRQPIQSRTTVTETKDGQVNEKEKIVMTQDDMLKACETKGKLEKLSEESAARIKRFREDIYKNVGGEDLSDKPTKRIRPETIGLT
jgi:hypothetical protein